MGFRFAVKLGPESYDAGLVLSPHTHDLLIPV